MGPFSLLDDDEPGAARYDCLSVDDLRMHLDSILMIKATETKAEHISATFNFSSNAIFKIVVSEAENTALDKAVALDPSLGGIRLSSGQSVSLSLGGSQYQRQIRALDALMSQGQDDPLLPRAVAKQITAALSPPGDITPSWNMRGMSRGRQGWTFEYICKDSMQAWQRQHAKGPSLPVVGLSTGKTGQHPINMSRPAFDCRGSVTVTFIKGTKTVEVKYHHTPLHRTVAELMDFFTPVQEPPPSHKRPAEEMTVDGEVEGPPNKKKKKSKKDSELPSADGASGEPSAEGGGAAEGADSSVNTTPKKRRPSSKPKKPRPSKSGSGDQGVSAQATQAQTQGDSAAAPSAVGHALLNLPPGEAQRRADTANNLLLASGIDPSTLSADQFSIFSNQSPDLQKESLAMLLQYGAERLRIVHPNKENSGSASGAMTNGNSAEASPATDSAKKKKKPRKTSAGEAGAGEEATPSKRTRSKTTEGKAVQTRGKCDLCKERKTKCSKTKPSCSECQEAGLYCYYRPQVSKKAEGEVVDAEPEPELEELENPEEPPPAAAEEAEEEQEEEQVEEQEEEEPDELPSPGFHQESSSAGWNRPAAPPDLSYQVQAPAEMQIPQQAMASSPLDFPQNLSFLDQEVAARHQQQVQPAMQQSPPVQLAQPVQPVATYTTPKSNGRRSLPSGQRPHASSTKAAPTAAAPNIDDPTPSTSSWQHATSSADLTLPTSTNLTPTSASPSLGYQMETRPRTSAAAAEYSHSHTHSHPHQPSSGSMQEATALSLGANYQASQPSPTVQNVAHPSRSKSRQSQRPQSRSTSRAQTSTPHRQQQQPSPALQSVVHTTSYTASVPAATAVDASSGSAGQEPYSQYYGSSHTGATATAAEQPGSTIGNKPYSSQPVLASSASYNTSYDTYNTRSQTQQAQQACSNPVTVSQSVSTPYTAATSASNTGQWPSATQSRTSQAYSPTSSGAGSSNRNTAASAQPPALQAFNVRPQPTAMHTRSSSRNSYHQQQAQPQPQPQAQPQQQRHQAQAQAQAQQQQQQAQQQQPNYGSYIQQPHANSDRQQQQQQNWYGFTPANNSSAGYGAAGSQTSSGNSYGGGHSGGSTTYNQRHRAMNLSGNTYGNMEASDTLYNLLQNGQGH